MLSVLVNLGQRYKEMSKKPKKVVGKFVFYVNNLYICRR